MKASLVAYDFKELHKKSKIKMGMSEAAQSSEKSKFGHLKF
jgi:hypothetical protein